MYTRLKCLFKRFYVFVRFSDVSLGHSANISKKTVFEGQNRIGKESWFDGYMGFGTYIGDRCTINAKIGRFCSIGHDVKVLIGTHPSHIFVSTSPVFYSLCKQNGTTFVNRQKFKEIVYADEGKKYGVIIGNDVWIGAGAVLLGGVEIGDGAIISAGAYVKEDIPPYNIFAGQPARRIGQRFTDTRIEWLISLKWWNKSLKWIRNNADSFENIEEFSKKIVFMDPKDKS
jgi:Acetyltransferase (isoleucine patch superfamily)